MIVDYIIIGVLILFSLLSIAFQLRKKIPFKRIWLIDPLGLLPNYSFFAPKPLQQDFRIVYRVMKEEVEEEIDWQEYPMYGNSNLSKMFYYPFKYYNKGMIDICMALTKEYAELKEEELSFIQISSNYLGILTILQEILHPKTSKGKKLEFAILMTEDHPQGRKAKVTFRSFKHII